MTSDPHRLIPSLRVGGKVRAAAIKRIRAELERGPTRVAVAGRLGVSTKTLSRWTREPELQDLEIVRGRPRKVPPTPK